jgi:hypothetical protein
MISGWFAALLISTGLLIQLPSSGIFAPLLRSVIPRPSNKHSYRQTKE